MSDARLLIIGGGVAGASCALSLARDGTPVDLVEKSAFPRNKVCGCCLGPAGIEMLDRLGLKNRTIEASVTIDHWRASFDSRDVQLPIPTGIAISRETLDPIILDEASRLGANVSMECSAEIQKMEPGGVEVALKAGDRTSTRVYDAVVVASGLSTRGIDSILPWKQSPHGPFGVACRTLAPQSTIPAGTIYMACNDDGYVGLVRLADDSVDIAAALRSGSKAKALGTPLARMQQIVSSSSFAFSEIVPIDGVLAAPMLRRTRLAGNRRVLAIGDAAGYVEPFTGEGMTWAMQSGMAAAGLLAGFRDLSLVGGRWQVEHEQLLRHKKRVCKLVTDACRNPLLRSSLSRVLSTFPSLANPLLKSINRV